MKIYSIIILYLFIIGKLVLKKLLIYCKTVFRNLITAINYISIYIYIYIYYVLKWLLNWSLNFSATEYHLGLLKAKLAKYRSQLLEPSKKSEKGEGFDVLKSGDARVALIGFPSVGKSTLLSTLTHTESEAASYEFTTLTCIPGVIEYKGANIQLLDLPGIIEGASQVIFSFSCCKDENQKHFLKINWLLILFKLTDYIQNSREKVEEDK